MCVSAVRDQHCKVWRDVYGPPPSSHSLTHTHTHHCCFVLAYRGNEAEEAFRSVELHAASVASRPPTLGPSPCSPRPFFCLSAGGTDTTHHTHSHTHTHTYARTHTHTSTGTLSHTGGWTRRINADSGAESGDTPLLPLSSPITNPHNPCSSSDPLSAALVHKTLTTH